MTVPTGPDWPSQALCAQTDEIHAERRWSLTIAMDQDTGAVPHVVEGRGAESLRGIARCLKLVRLHFPGAAIVYDHFHVIRLMP